MHHDVMLQKNRVYTAGGVSPTQPSSPSRVSTMLQENLSPAQMAKQAELEDKVEALRAKMRAAMMKVQAAKAASGGTL